MSDAVYVPTDVTHGLELQERASSIIPGMSGLLSKRPDQFAPGVWPGYFKRAKGVEVWDLDGNRYVDMSIGGIGANVLGYADPEVDAAVIRVIQDGTSCSLNCPEEVELAELLCELHFWAEMVRFARTGGEAMAIAVRIARAHTGRDKIAFCGYHGWHDWYLAANLGTENALGEYLLPGLEPRGVPRGLTGTAMPFKYNDLPALEKIVTKYGKELAAIVLEPTRNLNPDAGFLEGVSELARKTGAVLLVDEISAGFRINSGGAHLKLGFEPDMAVFSKALGNGYPIAAVIGKATVMEAAQSTFISSTCWTERVGPVAAIAMIQKHCRENAGKHLLDIGTKVQCGWRELGAKHGLKLDIKGIPPLSHFIIAGPDSASVKSLFVQMMLDKGFLASTSFYSMLAHTDVHVNDYLNACDQVFSEIVSLRLRGMIEKEMRGRPSVKGFVRLT